MLDCGLCHCILHLCVCVCVSVCLSVLLHGPAQPFGPAVASTLSAYQLSGVGPAVWGEHTDEYIVAQQLTDGLRVLLKHHCMRQLSMI